MYSKGVGPESHISIDRNKAERAESLLGMSAVAAAFSPLFHMSSLVLRAVVVFQARPVRYDFYRAAFF